MKIAIIGKGNVGSALTRGFTKAGHEVVTVGNDVAAVRSAIQGAEVVVLAVPFPALDAVVKAAPLDGKIVIDPTNALTADMQLALGFSTSGAEELQKKAPKARVVKAFNGVFAKHMDSGRVNNQQLALLIAGDDAAAKATVKSLGDAIGFDTIDAGPLAASRELEPLGYLNIRLGFMQKLGVDIGFSVVR